MGKSTAMKHLAITWTDGTAEELKKFDFVFHISLKHVRTNKSLAKIIIEQHNGLEANKVTPAEIKCILEDKKIKTLQLIDGHDEYKCGINNDIDKAIERKSLWNCWVILTSRETEQIVPLKQYMDAEAEIKGFNRDNIEAFVTKSLGDKEKEIMEQVNSRKLHVDILAIPLFLHMICVLFICNVILPKTRSGVFQAIVERCVNRESIRNKGKKAMDNAKQALLRLGKLAWEGLNEPGIKLIFDKVWQQFYLFNITTTYFLLF